MSHHSGNVGGNGFAQLADAEFAQIPLMQQLLVLVEEEAPAKSQLRRDLHVHFPDIRPKTVYQAISEAEQRGILISVNGHVEITPKGQALSR